MLVTRTAAALAAVASIGGAVAVAQPQDEGRSVIVQKLADCRQLTENSVRLACYDQAAAVLDQAEAKGDIVVVDREQARKVRRQAFGFSLPSISLFEKGEAQAEVENVAARVASARQNGAGKWVIRLEDGATWVQVDSGELFTTPRAGMTVKIRRAALGSYLMSVESRRAFRARRVE